MYFFIIKKSNLLLKLFIGNQSLIQKIKLVFGKKSSLIPKWYHSNSNIDKIFKFK